jgi:hypothetical protein
MGEFTQSLLKLTEFPFSYSLIGFLALIFGHGTNLEELSFTKIGPLLILMGFVATTLSICDSVGALQRLIIKRRSYPYAGYHRVRAEQVDYLNKVRIFGYMIMDYFRLPYLFAIMYSPESIKKKAYDVNWRLVQQAIERFELPVMEKESQDEFSDKALHEQAQDFTRGSPDNSSLARRVEATGCQH